MLVNHERRLLNRADGSVTGRIFVKMNANRSWPGDYSRLCVLESKGDLEWVGEHSGLDLGHLIAIWKITEKGRSSLRQLRASHERRRASQPVAARTASPFIETRSPSAP